MVMYKFMVDGGTFRFSFHFKPVFHYSVHHCYVPADVHFIEVICDLCAEQGGLRYGRHPVFLHGRFFVRVDHDNPGTAFSGFHHILDGTPTRIGSDASPENKDNRTHPVLIVTGGGAHTHRTFHRCLTWRMTDSRSIVNIVRSQESRYF